MIWSKRRRWLGNLVPLCVGGGIFFAVGWFDLLFGALVGVLITWTVINLFGFWENAHIRQELVEQLGKRGILVGVVFDRPADFLDAHAEVGLMSMTDAKIVITTEDRAIEVPWTISTVVGRRFNIHKLILLGGWISVANDGFPTLLLESREFDTMLASKRATDRLFQKFKQKNGGS